MRIRETAVACLSARQGGTRWAFTLYRSPRIFMHCRSAGQVACDEAVKVVEAVCLPRMFALPSAQQAQTSKTAKGRRVAYLRRRLCELGEYG